MLPNCVVEHTERVVDTVVIVTSGIVVDRSFVNKTLRSMLAKGERDIQSTHFFAYPSDTESELRSSQVLFQDSLALGVDDSDSLPVAPTNLVSNTFPQMLSPAYPAYCRTAHQSFPLGLKLWA